MVDTLVLGTSAARRVGSTPSSRTNLNRIIPNLCDFILAYAIRIALRQARNHRSWAFFGLDFVYRFFVFRIASLALFSLFFFQSAWLPR